MFAGEQVPRLRSGMCARGNNGFRAEVCFVDDDLIAGPRGNRREPVCFRDKRSAFRPSAFGRQGEEPNFSCRFDDNACSRCGSLRCLFRREILEAPDQRTGRQRRELPRYKESAIQVWRSLSWSGRLVTGERTRVRGHRRASFDQIPQLGVMSAKQKQAEDRERNMLRPPKLSR
jgi:hypothetical protein